jgi:hypothetical protein
MPNGESNWDTLFARLIGTRLQIAIVCTGGGSGAVSRCFRRPGASRNFIEAAVPYSMKASEAYLGRPPAESRASPEFAQQLALRAFERAGQLSDHDQGVPIGIALAAVMPTVPTNAVAERIHVALHRPEDRHGWSEVLQKGAHSRESAESVADEMIFRAIEFAVDHH